MFNESEIINARFIEELSLNAWPALQTIYYDGWFLRFADGYTHRANSVSAIYPSVAPTSPADTVEMTHEKISDKVRQCEAYYDRRGQKTTFKISPAVQPEDLDDLLAAQGYNFDGLTSVQTTELTGWLTDVQSDNIRYETALSQRWLDVYCRLANVDMRQLLTLKQLLNNIVPRHCFVMALHDQHPVAVGMVAIERGYCGLYNIVTDAAFRQRGFGTYLMRQMLFWAATHGADYAYLAVAANNEPAQRLYGAFGFKECYRYWYRIKAKRAL